MVGIGNNHNGHNRSPSNNVRPKVATSFGSAHELPKNNSAAFQAAVAGVALTKSDTNVDIANDAPPSIPMPAQDDFNDDELLALNASLKEEPNVLEQVFSTSIEQPEQIENNNYNEAAEYDYYYEDYEAQPEQEQAALVQPEPEPEPAANVNMYQPDNYVSQLLDLGGIDTTQVAAEPEPEREPIKQAAIPPPAPSSIAKPKPPPPSVPKTAVPPPAPTAESILSELTAAAQQAQNEDQYQYEEYDDDGGDYVEIEYEVVNGEEAKPPPAIIPEIEPEIVIETEAEQREYLSIEEAKKQTGGEKEKYLNDEDFAKIFGVTRDEFYKLPGWKQKQKKKSAGFF